jgi:Tol biopolymer transport system component
MEPGIAASLGPAPRDRPGLSPDGRRIAFTSDGHVKRGERERWGPDFELYLMRVNGTRIRRLTRNSVPDLLPDWQPIPR